MLNYKKIGIAFFSVFLCVGFYTAKIHAKEDIQSADIIAETSDDLVNDVEEETYVNTEEVIYEPQDQDTLEEPEVEEEVSLPITGIQKSNDYYVIYDENGDLLKGIQTYQGYAYILDKNTGAIQTGFVYLDNKEVYYCDEEGHIKTGEFTVDSVTVTTDKRGRILFADCGNVPYFNQRDPRWAYTSFGGGNISNTGCVLNVLTSIVNYFKNTNYTPVDIGRILYNAGLYNTDGFGAGGDAVVYFANYFNLDYVSHLSMNQVSERLKEGYLIAAAMNPGIFTIPGYTHEVLWYGYSPNSTNVYDPYEVGNNGKYLISTLYSQISTNRYDNACGGPLFAFMQRKVAEIAVDISNGVTNNYIKSQVYTGTEICPTIVLRNKVNGSYKTLSLNKDYTILAYVNNTETGIASILVKGNGIYTGERTITFRILDYIDDASECDTLDALAAQNANLILDGCYVIQSAADTNYALEVKNGSLENGANVQLYKTNNSDAQKWMIIHDEKGYVTLINVQSQLVMDVYGAGTENGTNVHQYFSNETLAQKWVIVETDTGYKIISALDKNIVLDLEGCVCENQSNIQIYSSNDTLAQRWIFV